MRFMFVRLLLLAMVLAVIQTNVQSARAAGRPCLAHYHATCYERAQVSNAERAMSISPVSPIKAVSRATHLSLVQVVVERSALPRAAGNVIAYSFGIAIPLDRPIRRTSRPAILVTEFVLPKFVQYTGVKSQPGTIPSALATFPHRRLALLVAGHFPLTTLRRIALEILMS
jgi:hypothetical protein